MKNKYGLSFFLAIMVIGLCASPSLAFWGDRGERKGPPPPRQFNSKKMDKIIANRLDLNAEQLKLFTEQNEKVSQLFQKNETQMKDLREKMDSELLEDKPDANAIHGYIRKMNELMTEVQIKRTDVLLKLQATLTPEQKAKFKDMTEHRPGPPPPPEGEGRAPDEGK